MDIPRRIQQGQELQQRGRLADAATIYRAVLQADPGNVVPALARLLIDLARRQNEREESDP